MSMKILIFIVLISSSLSNEFRQRQCQCQCCRYMGPLYPNGKNTCPCIVKDQGKPFTCGRSTGLFSARVCTSKISLLYDPNGPNLCCKLKFV